ncbi:MAG: cardiolipin synthase [Eubacterium sp.]|nr:cardiolipin synthase [Eubacterium sp.]MDD7208441.1 cardiolipin synthase [Lachnospiraceae bacterium]MDY5497998.1 cardiolipin synthase [Anaerobutyricum sp.]
MRKILKFLSQRIVLITFLILLQVLWFLTLFWKFTSYSQVISGAFKVLSVLVVIYIMNREDNPAVKLVWVIVILLMPLLGGLLYLSIGEKKPVAGMRKKLEPMIEESARYLRPDPSIEEELYRTDEVVASQVYYLEHQSGFPAYRNARADYYPSGEECFSVMVEELKKARRYIFLEYFILEEGIMWDTVLHILEEKVREGVDVRVMYDDVGCIFNLPAHYADTLREKGIRCTVFNRYIPVFSTVFNNRDHRKILVIDGNVAFTGGINFADEYINEKQRFGYWKDNGVRITGQAVYSMTQMFLQMWNAFSDEKLLYDNFPLSDTGKLTEETKGLVLPYSDHPLDSEFVGESVYINLINSAQKYLYFFTPYLIIDNEMVTALILAAKRGVDVRIITPGIPDKKLVFLVTQSYYPQLVKGGVKIFQYRPGFVHSKCAVCDDKIATVGTINLDFRSLYLHFENGIFLYNCDTVADIKRDILETLKDCNRITEQMCKKNMFFQFFQGILRIFAPLL